jgi:hypothetical protein
MHLITLEKIAESRALAGNAEPPPQQSRVGIAEVRALTGFGSMARRCTILLFRSDPFGGTHELLPCGLPGGDQRETVLKEQVEVLLAFGADEDRGNAHGLGHQERRRETAVSRIGLEWQQRTVDASEDVFQGHERQADL